MTTFDTRMSEDGRVMIPAPLRHRLGLKPGERLVLEDDGASVRLRTYAQVAREVQTAFAPYRTPGVSQVDELLAERRAEAAAEDAEVAGKPAGRGKNDGA